MAILAFRIAVWFRQQTARQRSDGEVCSILTLISLLREIIESTQYSRAVNLAFREY